MILGIRQARPADRVVVCKMKELWPVAWLGEKNRAKRVGARWSIRCGGKDEGRGRGRKEREKKGRKGCVKQENHALI